jgi:serpin B
MTAAIAFCAVLVFTFDVIRAGAKKKPKAGGKVEAVAKAGNRFAFDLYAKLRSRKGNLFVSPVSISTALSMTLGGARGNTAKERKETLHLTLADKNLHAATGKFLKGLSSDRKGLELSIANALWGQAGYPFLDEFLSESKKHYDAGFNLVDFKNDAEFARKTINKWVEDKTNDKIKELIKKGILTKDIRMVLTNAIYFNGKWRLKFKAKNTCKRKFNLAGNKGLDVYTMRMWNEYFNYMKGEGFAALEMPYKGNEYSMVILLPDKIDGLESLEAGLSADKLEKWLVKMETKKIKELSLPKFKVTSEFMLSETLQALGMKDAFVFPKADFSGMSTSAEGLFIKEVVHKTFVEANEEGTEAAAATAVMPTPGEPLERKKEKPIYFNVDRPFFFLIRQKSTGAIFFMGRINENPQKEGLKKLTKEQITSSVESHFYDNYTIDSLELKSEYGKHKNVWVAKVTETGRRGGARQVVLVLDQYTGNVVETD